MGNSGKTSRQIMVKNTLIEELNILRKALSDDPHKPVSYSEAIEYLQKQNPGPHSLVNKNFEDLKQILMDFFSGNADKAHITHQLHSLLIQAMKDDDSYEYISREIDNILSKKRR